MAKASLIPLEDHVLVEPMAQETTTKSGIILPEKDEKPTKGKVIAVGQGKILDNGQRAPIDVAVGDMIYFTKYSPDELEIDEQWEKKTYLVIKQASILAVEK